MTNTQTPTRIWFDTDRNGRKVAYRWSFLAFRSFRIGLAEAELLLSTEQAVNIGGHPLKARKEG